MELVVEFPRQQRLRRERSPDTAVQPLGLRPVGHEQHPTQVQKFEEREERPVFGTSFPQSLSSGERGEVDQERARDGTETGS